MKQPHDTMDYSTQCKLQMLHALCMQKLQYRQLSSVHGNKPKRTTGSEAMRRRRREIETPKASRGKGMGRVLPFPADYGVWGASKLPMC